MEAIIRLINYSAGYSARHFIRWTDVFLLQLQPRGLERAINIPVNQLDPSSLPIQHEDNEIDANDNEGKWNGFLWAAPKKRTSIMKRIRRKFGHSDYGSPLLKPKTNLRICDTCGHHHEAKHLCRNCYDRIMLETNEIRKNAEEQFGHGPVDKDIVVLYESETRLDSAEKNKNNILVEIPKPRPTWFSSNLLQKSTARPNTQEKSVTTKGPIPIISSSTSNST